MAIQYGDIKITWLGHAGALIEGTKKIYIDPYQIDNKDKPEADFLLITHSHYDHLSVPDIERIVTPNTIVCCPPDCQSKLVKFRMKALRVLEVGQEINEEGIKVKAIPAYNKNKPFHPKDNGWLGYVVTMDNVSIYHAGDTDFIPEMKSVKCHVALLPISGTYVMNAEEAAKAADLIEPEVAIPIHWGALIGTKEDVDVFKKNTKTKTIVLERE